MKVFVLLKQTFDTEEKISLRDGRVSEDGVKFVINPYDEYAVEEALRIKEASGASVTVLSAGPGRTAEALRTALAMGADEAVLISDSRIPSDEYAVSVALAAYLRNQSPDLLLGGSFSVDTGGGQVAVRVAELLGLPHVSSVTKLTLNGDSVQAERDAEGDLEVLDVTLPALFTAQQGLNEPRYPSLPGIMKAKKKPLRELALEDLGLSPEEIGAKSRQTRLFLPPSRSACRILQGDLPTQAAQLAELLRTQAKIL